MTTHPDICVIVPTIRHPDCVRAYVQNARSHGFNTDRLHFLILTEDFCDISAIESMLERLEVRGGSMTSPRGEIGSIRKKSQSILISFQRQAMLKPRSGCYICGRMRRSNLVYLSTTILLPMTSATFWPTLAEFIS
ncbi:MAG: hypothetical protein J07HQX50_01069 [Haloquadratum sp. J07HQX50]|nr:MAG: hypothetical protein J07HQX50_01069 [Haloquadratum sp. J07HQX50]